MYKHIYALINFNLLISKTVKNEGIIYLHTILIDIKHRHNSDRHNNDIEIDSMC